MIKHKFGENHFTLAELRDIRRSLNSYHESIKQASGEAFSAAEEINGINEIENKINEIFSLTKSNSGEPAGKMGQLQQDFNTLMSRSRGNGDPWDF